MLNAYFKTEARKLIDLLFLSLSSDYIDHFIMRHYSMAIYWVGKRIRLCPFKISLKKKKTRLLEVSGRFMKHKTQIYS